MKLFRFILLVLFSASLYGLTFTQSINTSSDDAEEYQTSDKRGYMYLNSSVLEMTLKGSTRQMIGLRFRKITIPQNATITNAYITFRANANTNNATSLQIAMQNAANPSTFTKDYFNISSRTSTSSVAWNTISSWSEKQYYDTPNLSTLVQQIVDRSDWASGNAMAFIISGTGLRSADSIDGKGTVPAKLTIEYTVAKRPPIMGDVPDQAVSLSTSFSLNLSNYVTLTESDPILGYTLSGTLPTGLSFNATTGVISGTATSTGSWTLSATAKDVDGVSNADSFTMTVAMPIAPVASSNSYTTELNVAVSGNVMTDGIADTGTDISVVLPVTTAPAHGSLNIKADGSFTYKPDKDFSGSDTFTYTIIDIFDRTSSATVTITVNNNTSFHNGAVDFTLTNPLETRNIIGNYTILGNTVECITQKVGSSTESGSYAGTCQNGNTYNDNNYMAKYIDIDGTSGIGASTWNSSSSSFTLPATYFDEAGSDGILWAGIFWQGAMHNNAGNYKQRRGYLSSGAVAYKNITSDESLDIETSDANKILIRFDNDTAYTQIKANDLYYNKAFGSYGGYYAAYADITTWLQGKQPDIGRHTITVANLSTNEGRESGTGNYGGWSIVVIYKETAAADAKARNISIYKGYTKASSGNTPSPIPISGFRLPSSGVVNAQFSTFSGEGEYIYGNDGNEYDRMVISNQSDMSNSQTMPGAIDPDNIFDAILAGIDRDSGNDNDMTGNNNGIDVDSYDVSSIMTAYRDADSQISTVYIGLSSNNDYITPSMMAFSAELYKPNLCYDYAYKQGIHYFTEDNNGSQLPRIVGSGLDTSLPVDVEFYVQNKEDSDISLSNMTLNIQQIDTAQAIYTPNSTSIIAPGDVFAEPHVDTDYGESYNNDILVGNGVLDSEDYFYLYYSLDLKSSTLDMPLVIELNYQLNVAGANSYPTVTYTTTLPLCSTDNFNYNPAYGIFNVEDSSLTYLNNGHGYYNLPTQTVKRVGNFAVTAYEHDNSLTRKNVSTVVAVELVDAGAFHGIEATCTNPKASVTPRIWLTFDNNVSRIPLTRAEIQNAIDTGAISDAILNQTSKITTAEEFFQIASVNTAFRVSYNGAGSGDLITVEPVSCKDGGTCYDIGNFTEIIKYNGGNCAQDVDGNPKNIDKIPQFCDNAGSGNGANMTQAELAQCMECVYGFDIHYLCSRDNFAVRPESFRMTLKDQNQTASTQKKLININNDVTVEHNNDNLFDDDVFNTVADYRYDLEINATSHQDDKSVVGYKTQFDISGSQPNQYISLRWHDGTYNTSCNDTADQNFSATFLSGAADINISSTNIGKYDLSIFDKIWTSVDWDSQYRNHHKFAKVTVSGTEYDAVNVSSYFFEGASDGTDCVINNSDVPVTGTLTGITGLSLSGVSGCDITSANHTNVNTGAQFADIPLFFHPYRFNTAGLKPQIGPYTRAGGQNFVYINTPNGDDKNMTYNMNGTFYAAGENNESLSNFVNGCYASDVNMTLYIKYNHTLPTNQPYLSYDIVDHNTTNPNVKYWDPRDPLSPSAATSERIPSSNGSSDQNRTWIKQLDNYFVKDMKGHITMDLGYNFKRNFNVPLNPRYIRMNDFNITYVTQPDGVKADMQDNFIIFGNKVLDQNVSFVYGRAKPAKTFYERVTTASVNTPVSVVTYCDLGYTECQNRGILALDARTDESDWWLSVGHVTAQGDGDITLSVGTPTQGSGTPSITPASPNTVNIATNATDTNVIVSRGPSPVTLPMIVPINIRTSPDRFDTLSDDWLIYNENANNADDPFHFYNVEFIGVAQWTGIGNQGFVVDTNTSARKTKRLDW